MIGELAVPHSVLRQIVGAGVQHPEVLFPQELSLHVERVEALRSEERDDAAAVGGRRRVRVGRLDVPLLARHALVRRALPHDLSTVPIDRDHDPALRRAILRRRAFAVQPRLERRVRPAADRGGHEDAVARHNRARMRQPRHRRRPDDVLAGGDVPGVRRPPAVADAGGGRAAESGPARRRRGGPQCPPYNNGQGNACRRGSGSERSSHGHHALNKRTGATPARRR